MDGAGERSLLGVRGQFCGREQAGGGGAERPDLHLAAEYQLRLISRAVHVAPAGPRGPAGSAKLGGWFWARDLAGVAKHAHATASAVRTRPAMRPQPDTVWLRAPVGGATTPKFWQENGKTKGKTMFIIRQHFVRSFEVAASARRRAHNPAPALRIYTAKRPTLG